MSSPKVEAEARGPLPPEAAQQRDARPRDVERFQAALRDDAGELLVVQEGGEPAVEEGAVAGAASDAAGALTLAWPSAGTSGKPATAAAVREAGRIRLRTHAERSRAMAPLAEMLATLHQRSAGRAVQGMRIVPGDPNPLGLTLQLSMTDGAFLVKVHTTLDGSRREEVQQALHLLETALKARVGMPSRVVLLA